MKLKEKIKQRVEAVKERLVAAKAHACKHPIRTAALVLTPPALVAALVKLIAVTVDLLTKTAETVALFLDRNFITIALTCALVVWLATWRGKRKEEREARKRLEREQERAHWVREYEATKDATYTKEGKMVLSVVKDMGIMGIVPPSRLSEIYSPGRTTPIEGGAGMLCQYLVQKAHDVDEEQFKTVMQTKVDQRLAAGEWPGVKAQHVYDGRVYSGFIIHKVRDSPGGGYLEVYTALVNDAYCRYVLDQELDKDTPPPPVDRLDPDY